MLGTYIKLVLKIKSIDNGELVVGKTTNILKEAYELSLVRRSPRRRDWRPYWQNTDIEEKR